MNTRWRQEFPTTQRPAATLCYACFGKALAKTCGLMVIEADDKKGGEGLVANRRLLALFVRACLAHLA